MRFLLALLLPLTLATGSTASAAEGIGAGEARVGRVHGGVCPRGDAAVASGRVLWCGYGSQHLATRMVWSQRKHAVAFATRGPRGQLTLRVAMVSGPFEGTLLSWPVTMPRSRSLEVMWLGSDRVGVGRNAVRPLLVASWRLRHLNQPS